MRRPPRMGNADIDQTESNDLPNLNRKEAEDFDRLIVEAKKEKEEKEKKEKEEKEKKEKEDKDKKGDKKSFSQRKHKHHRHHHKKPHHQAGYVQLNQEFQTKQNSSILIAKNTTVNTTQSTNVNKTAVPQGVNVSKPVQVNKNESQSKKEFKQAVKMGQMVLKNNNTSGNIDLVQKNSTKQNVTSLAQQKSNSTKPIPVVQTKNTTKVSKKGKKSQKNKHFDAPI